MDGPHLPAHVSAERVEQFLDRVSLEIAHRKERHLPGLLLWYDFLEKELELRRRPEYSLDSALERAKRLQIHK
jgi:hypothetical protein